MPRLSHFHNVGSNLLKSSLTDPRRLPIFVLRRRGLDQDLKDTSKNVDYVIKSRCFVMVFISLTASLVVLEFGNTARTFKSSWFLGVLRVSIRAPFFILKVVETHVWWFLFE